MKQKFWIFPFVQGLYFLITAIWPMLDIESFMKVTGPKTDVWLVISVSYLLIPYTLICLRTAFNRNETNQLIKLNMILVSVFLAGVEFYYYLNGTIRWVYAVDGIFQLIFAGWWTREWCKKLIK